LRSKETLTEINFITNTEMKKLLVALTIAGLFSALAPLTLANLGSDAPKGLAFDSSGNLFVARNTTGTIVKFTPDGHRSTFASGLIEPVGLAFDAADNLFIAAKQSEREGGVILKFARDGSRSTFASGLAVPLGLAFDSAGNLFVVDMAGSDTTSGAILKFAPDGTRSTVFKAIRTKLGSTTLRPWPRNPSLRSKG
jgi:sugar lactone lactonase YvrE